MGEARSAHGRDDKCIYNFGRKISGKETPRRPRRRWKDVSLDLTEIGWEAVDWVHLVQVGTGGRFL